MSVAAFWAEFDSVPRGTSPEPAKLETPPHASVCFTHGEQPLYFRSPVCPRCRCEAMGQKWETELRIQRVVRVRENNLPKYAAAVELRQKGTSYEKISKILGLSIGLIHGWLNPKP